MLIHDIADYAIAERARSLPDEIFHHAKRAVIDWCATTAPGSVLMPATGLIKALDEDVGRGNARLFPSAMAATMRGAAVINAAASHTVEFDDIFRDAIYHPGTATISSALAAAETYNSSGEDFLRAVIIGYEISTRIALVMGREHYKYWHNTATNGSFGATAAVATVLKLNRDQFANAIGLVGTMAAGLQQAFRSDSHGKPMHSAHAAESGVLCARSAAQGVTGALDILEGEVGYGTAMSRDCDWTTATRGLGEHYNIACMTFKNHACCGHAFAAIDAALALRERHSLKPGDIKRIRVGGYSATIDTCGSKRHSTPFEGKFSLAYLIATAIAHGSVRLSAFTDERLNDPATESLIHKIDLYLDPDIDAAFPRARSARIQIETFGGTVLEQFQPTRKGDPDMPFSDDEVSAKFTEMVSPVTGDNVAKALLARCWSLKTLGSMRDLPMASPEICERKNSRAWS
ncbi:MAG: MmgE/PrpD family protein [Anaerolineae bacterium]